MRIVIFLLVCILSLNSQPLEGFSDFFVVYGKRNGNIKKVFIEALNTEGKKWQELGLAYPHKPCMKFVFVPEKQNSEQIKNVYDLLPTEKLIYGEYDFKNEEHKIDDIEDFVNTRLLNNESELHFSDEKIFSKNENEARIQVVLKPKPQPFQVYKQINGVSVLMESRERIPASAHYLFKVIKTGKMKFSAYTFMAKNMPLSQEEVDYWFKLFDYARIDF